MSERLVPALVTMAVAAWVVGAALAGLWAWLPVAAIVAGVWLAGLWRAWGWSSAAGFAAYTIAAAGCVLQGAGVGWMLFGLATAVAAWDLDGFSRRIERAERVDDRRYLERRHLVRLAAVELVGLLLAGVSQGVRLDLGFGLLLLLGLLAVVGLSRGLAVLGGEDL